jgi:hypothetical protein
MIEWSKYHVVVIGPLNSKLSLIVGTWLNWRPAGPLWESEDSWLGRSGSGDVASRHHQGCSPRLCRLRTVRLTPVNKYWTYRSHASDMSLVSRCSCVTIGPKSLSPTLGLSHGRRNEVTQDDGWASLSFVVKTYSRCRGMFQLRESQWKVVTYGDCPQKAYAGHAWTGVGSLRGMLVGFSPAGCTSIRFAVTLRYE